jgi:PAS domain S-box-containing protein
MHAVFTRRMSRRELASLLVFAAAYVIAARLSLLLAIPPGYAAPFWPAAGIALAGILVGSARLSPAIWLGSFFTNLGIGFEATTSTALFASLAIPSAIGLGAALQACGGAFLVRRFVGFPSALTRGREVVLFLLMGGPLSCLINATIGTVALAVGGKIPWTIALLTWTTWWTGDTLGVLIMTPLMLSWLAQPHHIWRRRRISVALPLVGTLTLAVVIFAYADAQERERLALLFERQATALGQTLQSSLDNYLDELSAVGSFFASVPAVGRRAFHLFVQRSLSRHPGLQALSWDRRVPDTLREAYEEAMRREGFPFFQITEHDADGQLVAAARRPEYVVVSYIEPYAGNERALGFDVASAPERRIALQQARNAGEPRATGRLALVQAPSRHLGLLVFLPVYDPNLPRATVEERRHSLQGYVVGVFQIDEMIAAALQPVQWAGIVLRIEDETAPAGRGLIYDSRWRGQQTPGLVRNDESGEVVHMAWVTSLALAGQRWVLRCTPTLAYLTARQSLQPWFMLVGSLVFASLLGAFLLIMSGRALTIEQLMAERTAQLEASQRAEERFRLAVESAPNAMVTVNQQGTIVLVNSQAEQLFGYTRHELIGQSVEILVPERFRAQHPELRPSFSASPKARPVGAGRDLYGRRKDGSEVPVEIGLNPIATDEGSLILSAIVDITARKQAEREIRALNEALEQRVAECTAQLEATLQELAAFSYSIAHDLRAPLRAIHGFAHILLDERAAQLDAEAQGYLQRIASNALHMSQLIDDLLAFIQLSHQPLRKQLVASADLVHDVLKDLRHTYEHRRVDFTIGALPPCHADPTLLRQVWANLLDNALKFTRQREVARIEIGSQEMAGERVYLVRDNGVGFEMRYMSKLFGVFQRLHHNEGYEATGVGLALTQRILQRHGGRIWAEAEVDRGATFYFTLGA